MVCCSYGVLLLCYSKGFICCQCIYEVYAVNGEQRTCSEWCEAIAKESCNIELSVCLFLALHGTHVVYMDIHIVYASIIYMLCRKRHVCWLGHPLRVLRLYSNTCIVYIEPGMHNCTMYTCVCFNVHIHPAIINNTKKKTRSGDRITGAKHIKSTFLLFMVACTRVPLKQGSRYSGVSENYNRQKSTPVNRRRIKIYGAISRGCRRSQWPLTRDRRK